MNPREYFGGVCPFLIYQDKITGAILICLTNGKEKACTTLSLHQVMELDIPLENMNDFNKTAFDKHYQLTK